MNETIKRARLEDVMVAMDVVDTLRHREKFVSQELDSEGRREKLIARLRDIYAAQGIEVTDSVLEEGVRALEEDRFSYTAPGKSFSTLLAHLYVKRRSWGKPILTLVMACVIGWSLYHFAIVRPELVRHEQMPAQIQSSIKEFTSISKDKTATTQAKALSQAAKVAMNNGRYDEAAKIYVLLKSMLEQLKNSYQIRVVSRPDERSGAWRIPDINTKARNYYLIVEAVNKDGDIVKLPITNEETGKTSTAAIWGLRVDEQTFNTVAADKRDDGIIQGNIVGVKKRGELKPNYNISTNGSAITEW